MPGKAYKALCAEAALLGWPKHYQNDLFIHDQEICSKLAPGERFIWAIRECGTHIVRGSNVEAFMSAREIRMAFGGEATKFYLWDGESLAPVDIDAMPRLYEAIKEKT